MQGSFVYLKGVHFLSWILSRINFVKYSMAKMKIYGEIGSPCRIPLAGSEGVVLLFSIYNGHVLYISKT